MTGPAHGMVSAGGAPGTPGRWWRKRRAEMLLALAALPAMAFLFVFYLLPMGMLLLQSVEGGSLAAYDKALTDSLYVGVLIDTMLIAAYVSVACLLLGVFTSISDFALYNFVDAVTVLVSR